MKKLFFILSLLLFGIGDSTRGAVNLAITGGNVPNSMYVCSTYTVQFTVKNTGSTPTSANFYVNVSIHTNSSYGGQTYLTDILVTGGIGAGQSRNVSKQITIPCSYSIGIRYILAGADALNDITESNESDNNFSLSILLQNRPDLTPLNYSLSSLTVNAGDPVTAYFAVNNSFTNTGGSFNVGFYLSNSTTLNTSQATYLGGYSVSALSANSQTILLNKLLFIPSTFCSGTKYLFIWVDNNHDIIESAENNNFQYKAIFINGSNSSPPTSVFANPASITPGNTTTLNVSGGTLGTGASWKWYTGNCGSNLVGFGNSISVSPTTTTTYYVRAEGTCNITSCGTVTVEVGCPAIIPTVSKSNVSLCSGNSNGSISIPSVSGGSSPYQYSINNGSNYQSSTSFSNLFAGTYQVKVRDNNNCLSATQNVTIAEPNSISVSTSQSNVTCGGCSNGSISVFASGGSGSYQYSKNNGGVWQSSNTFTGLVAGTYHIRVKDGNGCLSTAKTVTIIEPPIVSLIMPSNNNINAGESIHFSAVVSNNPSGWNWTFKGGDQYSIAISNLQNPTVAFNRPGTYRVSLSASNAAGTSNTFQTQVGFITVKPSFLILSSPKENYVIQQGYPSKKEAEPVNVATGSYEYSHTDFDIPAIKTRLQFTRFYNSVNTSDRRTLGHGWTHTYDFSIDNQGDSIWVVHYGDGHSSYFIPVYNGNGASFPLSHGTMERLIKNTGTGAYTLTYKTGEVYHFSSSGKITSMVDLNGNTTTFTYSGNNLITVTTPGGRTLSLTYGSSGITSVTDQLLRSVHFSYDLNGNLSSVTDVDSGVTNFTYDALHRITAITLPLGDTLLTNIYDSSGWVIAQSDVYNETTTFSYDIPDTGFVTITYPDNNSIVVQHDSLYRLVSEKDELGNVKTFVYDYNNRPTVVTDENGVSIFNTYDTLGNLIKRKSPEGISSLLTYNSQNRPTHMIDPSGDTTTFTYNAGVNPVQILLPGNKSIHNTYYGNGLLKTTKDPMGYLTEFFYNSRGDLTSVVSFSGTKAFEYDSVGRLISYSDENQHKTVYTYNNKDKLIKVTDALGYSIEDSFDINDNLVLSRDKNGNETQYGYDRKDRLEEILLPNSAVVKYKYDKRDNIEKITDANGNIVTYDYDNKQRLKTITGYLGMTGFGYDKTTNRTSVQDANNNTSYFEYDSLYRLTVFKDALSNSYSYDYDELGQTTSIKDPLNRPTNFTYNSSKFLEKVTDARNKSADMTYDNNGNVISVKDLNAHTQYFAYDSSNRLIMHKDASNKVDSFYYDGVGNIIKISKPTGTITRTFDSVNRLTKVVNSTGDTYEYTYDGNGNFLSIANNTGTSYFTYDNMNRLTRYIDVYNDTVLYAYDSVGNRTKIIYPDGHAVAYEYNQENLLETVTDWLSHSTRYTYDQTGLLTASINPFGDTCKYIYDEARRLVEHVNIIGDSVITKSVFTLNAAGEKVQEQITGPVPFHLRKSSYSYTYEQNDALTSDSVTSYTNDNAGNRLTGNNTYAFTVDNLLRSAGTTSYTYDALGNRVARSDSDSHTKYVLDLSGGLSQVLQERDSNGIVKASYIYGLGLIARIDSSGDIQYYHFDAQHNTVALSDDSGRITDTYVYEPFGLLLEHIGNTDQPYTFLGKYGIQKEDSTIYYIRARYYDAANHRFLSKDTYPATFADPQTLNRYVYGLNNPVSVFDVTGLFNQRDNSKQNGPSDPLNTVLSSFDLGVGATAYKTGSRFISRVGVVGSIVSTGYSVGIVRTQYKQGGISNVNFWDATDIGVGAIGLGAVGLAAAGLISAPVAVGIGIGVSIYTGGRLLIDFIKDL